MHSDKSEFNFQTKKFDERDFAISSTASKIFIDQLMETQSQVLRSSNSIFHSKMLIVSNFLTARISLSSTLPSHFPGMSDLEFLKDFQAAQKASKSSIIDLDIFIYTELKEMLSKWLEQINQSVLDSNSESDLATKRALKEAFEKHLGAYVHLEYQKSFINICKLLISDICSARNSNIIDQTSEGFKSLLNL